MASGYASYASWQSVDDTVANATIQVGSQQPQDEAEPPKSVDQGTDDDEKLGPGDWETDPVDITPGKSEAGSQQPQDEAELPKPPAKRQCRSKASLLGLEGSQLSFSLSQSQPVGASSQVADGSQSQPVDGSQSQQIDWATVSVVVIDGSQSQPVVDGS